MVYLALQLLMRTPRLPVVDRTDAPRADLNGLARFAEKRNLVSARVSSHFNCPLQNISGKIMSDIEWENTQTKMNPSEFRNISINVVWWI
jgi:hypothetical protein